MRLAGFALTLWAVVVLVLGCAKNPVTGKSEFSLVSSQQELSMGAEGYKAVLQEYGAYDDPKISEYVTGIGNRLAAVSHLPNLQWHFTVLDDPAVNAFAMPGGYIYITRGILAHLDSEAQLAGVMGHEEGHVTARHSAKQITQQQLFGIGFGVAMVASSGFARYGGAAQQALGLLFLKYSRDDENQADQLGVDYATKAGFDPREIPNTYVMLKRVSDQAGQRVPTFMSTHPDPGDRQQRTTALAQAAAAGKTGLVIHNRDYVQRLDGMVFGADPRQGFFDGRRFIQPELKFEITFPDGWKTQNTREAVLAQAADQSGVMQLTLVPSQGFTPSAFVQQLVRNQQIADAQGGSETIGGHAAWLGRVQMIQKDGSAVPIVLGLVQRTGEDVFQIIGQAPRDDRPVTESIRSLRDLGSIGPVTPDRVAVVTVPKTGTFSSVVSSLGPQAISVEATAILNNVDLDETVAQGTVIKIVKKGSRGH